MLPYNKDRRQSLGGMNMTWNELLNIILIIYIVLLGICAIAYVPRMRAWFYGFKKESIEFHYSADSIKWFKCNSKGKKRSSYKSMVK